MVNKFKCKCGSTLIIIKDDYGNKHTICKKYHLKLLKRIDEIHKELNIKWEVDENGREKTKT